MRRPVQRSLEADVRAVRLSRRLVHAPVSLACEEADDSPRLEQLLMRGKGGGPRQRRVLELNPQHPMIGRLLAQVGRAGADPLIDSFARLLLGQALIAEAPS